MCIEVDVITGPAVWASALTNGDLSGLDDAEEAALDAWVSGLGGWYVVDVVRDEDGVGDEPRFTWSYDLYGGTAKGGDVIDYVVHRAVEGST